VNMGETPVLVLKKRQINAFLQFSARVVPFRIAKRLGIRTKRTVSGALPLHKPARKQGRYAQDRVTYGDRISPSLTVGLVHAEERGRKSGVRSQERGQACHIDHSRYSRKNKENRGQAYDITICLYTLSDTSLGSGRPPQKDRHRRKVYAGRCRAPARAGQAETDRSGHIRVANGDQPLKHRVSEP
jgi:hypothetical protein